MKQPTLKVDDYDGISSTCSALIWLSGSFPVASVEASVLRTAWMVLDAEREALRPLRIKQLVAA